MHNGDLKYKKECQRALELMKPDSQIVIMVKNLLSEIEKMESAWRDGSLFHMEELFHKGERHDDGDVGRRDL